MEENRSSPAGELLAGRAEEFDTHILAELDLVGGDELTAAENIFPEGLASFDVLAGELQVPLHSVLLLNKVIVDSEFRGMRLGPLLVSEALYYFGRDHDLWLTYPSPFLPVNREMGEQERRTIAMRLCQTWAACGFRPYRDGYMATSPHLPDPAAARLSIREEFGLSAPNTYEP